MPTAAAPAASPESTRAAVREASAPSATAADGAPSTRVVTSTEPAGGNCSSARWRRAVVGVGIIETTAWDERA